MIKEIYIIVDKGEDVNNNDEVFLDYDSAVKHVDLYCVVPVDIKKFKIEEITERN